MSISPSWQPPRRAGNGSDFCHGMLNTREEKGSVKNVTTMFATPKKNKAMKYNSFKCQQRQLQNAEPLGEHEITTGLNLNISQPNNF